ncbi:hypothetical protein GCM10027089_41890 [Nocardia thraciensis]
MRAGDFHDELRATARVLPRSVVGRRSLPLLRALTSVLKHRVPQDVTVEKVGPVTARVFRPSIVTGKRPGLLSMHGGGYVFGVAAQDDHVCRHFARELDILVAAVDYRLAPEHSFPVPLEDCYTALTWLASRADVDSARIAVGGASAGGGLAAALALLARDRGAFRPALQLLTYPMLDDRTALRQGLDESKVRCGTKDPTTSAGSRTWADRWTAPSPRNLQSPPALPTCPAYLPPGSVSAPSIYSMTRTSPSPTDSHPPERPVTCSSWTALSTDST